LEQIRQTVDAASVEPKVTPCSASLTCEDLRKRDVLIPRSVTIMNGVVFLTAIFSLLLWTSEVGVMGALRTSAAIIENDDIANAILLTGRSGEITGNNTLATRAPGEPLHANRPGIHSVWYRWTAPATSEYLFTLHGSEFDTLLGIYSKDDGGRLIPVASNDDVIDIGTFSTATFSAQESVEYWIAVDGKFGSPVNLGGFFLGYHPIYKGNVFKLHGTARVTVHNCESYPGVLERGAFVIVRDSSDELVATTATEPDGQYSIDLPSELRYFKVVATRPLGMGRPHHVSGPTIAISTFVRPPELDSYVFDFDIIFPSLSCTTASVAGRLFGAIDPVNVAVSAPSLSTPLPCIVYGDVVTINAHQYRCAGVPAYGAFTITPSMANATFGPASFSTINTGLNFLNVDFYASTPQTSNFRGLVTSGGRPIPGAVVMLKSIGETYTRTDNDGFFEFRNLAITVPPYFVSGPFEYKVCVELKGFEFTCHEFTNAERGEYFHKFEGFSACDFRVSPSIQYIPPSGGFFEVLVSGGECDWSAVSLTDWAVLASSAVKSNGRMTYYVEPLESGPRTGTLAIAGQGIIIAQRPFVEINGRATTEKGIGLRGVLVRITNGEISASATTGPLGYFSFENMLSDLNYKLTADAKRYRFAAQEIVPRIGSNKFVDLLAME
jgi:hypothetical protein